jgi:hypothetical protein
MEEARSDLAREIHMRPRRFHIKGAPKQIAISPLPAPEMENQGGWFFEVIIESDEGITKLYITNSGCSRLDIAVDTR